MMMNRRNFSTALLGVTAASLISSPGMAANVGPIGARNIVFVHGLFADGSCWSEVIARLQARGLNCTSVQNPLTTLPEAVASAQMVLDQQDGPTVFVGHSFSGMILTEAGVHPKVSAVVYVAARAPDAGEDYSALASFPRRLQPLASSSTATKGALLRRRFSATLPAICRRRRQGCFMPSRSLSTKRCWPARPPTRLGARSRTSMQSRRKTGRSIPT
jgi:pimeloyl-ACP methyl ester carboxylesterase